MPGNISEKRRHVSFQDEPLPQHHQVAAPKGILKGRQVKSLSQKETRDHLTGLLFDKMTVLGSRLTYLKQEGVGTALLTKTGSNTFNLYINTGNYLNTENHKKQIEKINLTILRDGKISDGSTTFNNFEEILQTKQIGKKDLLKRGNVTEEKRIFARARRRLHGQQNGDIIFPRNEGRDKRWQVDDWLAVKTNGVITLQKFECKVPKKSRRQRTDGELKKLHFDPTTNFQPASGKAEKQNNKENVARKFSSLIMRDIGEATTEPPSKRIRYLVKSIGYVFEDAYNNSRNLDSKKKMVVFRKYMNELDKLMEGEYNPKITEWKVLLRDGDSLFPVEVEYRDSLKKSAMKNGAERLFGFRYS